MLVNDYNSFYICAIHISKYILDMRNSPKPNKMTNQIELEYIASEELHQPLPTIKTCFFCWSTNSEKKKDS